MLPGREKYQRSGEVLNTGSREHSLRKVGENGQDVMMVAPELCSLTGSHGHPGTYDHAPI